MLGVFFPYRALCASNLCERRLLISRLIVVVLDFFFSKRSGDGDAEIEAITDAVPGETKPQKEESLAIIHVQKNVAAPLEQNTEISAIAEHPKDVRVNETARDVVQPSSAPEPSVEKLLTTSKPTASRSESDFEPPPCNCPGIYIFFLLVFLFKSTEILFISSRREYCNRGRVGLN